MVCGQGQVCLHHQRIEAGRQQGRSMVGGRWRGGEVWGQGVGHQMGVEAKIWIQ